MRATALAMIALVLAGCSSPEPEDPRNPYGDAEMARLLAEKDRIEADQDARCPIGQKNRTPECEAVQRSRDAQSDIAGIPAQR